MENESQGGSREQKRAQFTEKAPAKAGKVVPIIAAVAILLAVAVFLVLRRGSDSPAATAVSTQGASAPSPEIRIPLSDLSGQAKFFTYPAGENKRVRFFALRSSDGVFRVALDACDTCYHAGKGYHQEGDDMVCNNCGQHFPSAHINDVRGGCSPVGLPRTIDAGAMIIKTSDLEERRQYF